MLVPSMGAVAAEANNYDQSYVSGSLQANLTVSSNDRVSLDVFHKKEIDNLVDGVSTSLNKKQYDKFIDLTTGSLNLAFSDLFFGLDSQQNKEKNIGLWNLSSLKIIKYKQIPNSQVPSGSVHYNDYSAYNDIVTYYVSSDIETNEDNSDMFSGINYYIWVFGKDIKGDYKLLQWSQPVIKEMKQNKLAYNDGTEDLQNTIQDARLHGKILNGKGVEIQNSSTSSLSSNYIGNSPIPSNIRVKMASTGSIVNLDFITYVKNVLPNEWTAGSDPIEALRSGAMVVKMYGWYRCYVPKYYGLGFDVYSDTRDQVYKPVSAYPRSSTAVDDINGYAIMNTDWNLFETQYLGYTEPQYGGILSQPGSITLANSGNAWFQICSYYYSMSNKSTDMISIWRY